MSARARNSLIYFAGRGPGGLRGGGIGLARRRGSRRVGGKTEMSHVLAIVGATGAVGQEFLTVLDERKYPMDDLKLFASPRSAGSTISFRGRNYKVQALEKG